MDVLLQDVHFKIHYNNCYLLSRYHSYLDTERYIAMGVETVAFMCLLHIKVRTDIQQHRMHVLYNFLQHVLQITMWLN